MNSVEDILHDFPTLKSDDVQAVIACAAASAEEDLPVSANPVPGAGAHVDTSRLPGLAAGRIP